MSSRYEEVHGRIDAFLTELDLLVRQAALQAIQLALSGEEAPATAAAPPALAQSDGPRTTAKVGKLSARRKAAASAALEQSRAKRRSAKEPSGRTTARGGANKRSADQLGALMGSTLKYIHRHAGSRMEQIAEGMGVPSKELTLPLRHLKSQGRLKTKGQKRATSYFAK